MALVPTEPEHEVDDGQGRGARARAARASQSGQPEADGRVLQIASVP